MGSRDLRGNAKIAIASHPGGPFAVGCGILRGPCCEAIHVTVVHAEGGGNQYGVVNFLVGGALLAGPIGDRFGRKPLLLISLALFGAASLASAFSPSLGFLAGTRFFTGAGIAGGFAPLMRVATVLAGVEVQ